MTRDAVSLANDPTPSTPLRAAEPAPEGAIARVVADHPWLSLGAAVTAGAVLGVRDRRAVPEPMAQPPATSSAGKLLSAAGVFALRAALVPLSRAVVAHFIGGDRTGRGNGRAGRR